MLYWLGKQLHSYTTECSSWRLFVCTYLLDPWTQSWPTEKSVISSLKYFFPLKSVFKSSGRSSSNKALAIVFTSFTTALIVWLYKRSRLRFCEVTVVVLRGQGWGIERSRLRSKRCSFLPKLRPELLPEKKLTCGKLSDAQSNDIVNKNVVLDTPFNKS